MRLREPRPPERQPPNVGRRLVREAASGGPSARAGARQRHAPTIRTPRFPCPATAMCGRYTLTKLEDVLRQFPFVTTVPDDLKPRYNIAPTQPVPVIANNRPDRVELFHWGLIPSWAKDPSIGSRMI